MAFGNKDKKNSSPARPAPPAEPTPLGDSTAAQEIGRLRQEVERLRQDLETARDEKNRHIEASRQDRKAVEKMVAEKVSLEGLLKRALEAQTKAEASADAVRRGAEAERARLEEKLRAIVADADGFAAVERERRMRTLDEEIRTRRARADEAFRQAEEDAEQSLLAAEERRRKVCADAERVRSEAHEVTERAQAEATAVIATARDDADRIRAEARNAAAAELRAAREGIDKTSREERTRVDAEAARRLEAATREALAINAKAETEALVQLRSAEAEALEKERRAADVLARAEAAATDAHERRRRELETGLTQLELDRAALEQEKLAVETERKKNARRTEALDQAHREVADELAGVGARLAALKADEQRLGPAAVERLERKVAELDARLEESRTHHVEAAKERDRLRTELEGLEGVGAAGRTVELERLRSKVATLQAELASRHDESSVELLRREIAALEPYKAEVHGLRQRNEELLAAQEQCDRRIREVRRESERLQKDKLAVEGELAAVTEELESANARVAALSRVEAAQEALQVQIEHETLQRLELQRRLDQWNKDAKRAGQEHYGVLARLDETPPTTGLAPPSKSPVLADLVDHIRDFAANQEPRLFYEKDTIRAFLAGLSCADLSILQGPSGTGKTSLPAVVGDAIGAKVFRIPVQAGWRDNTDLLGYYNAFTRTFRASRFTESLYTARLPDFVERPVFIVLDECNLSQMEYYFADFLSDLEDWRQEPEIRLLDVEAAGAAPAMMPDGKTLKLPRNVRYFGTANQDESTCGIADKTYDRAAVLMLEERGRTYKPAHRVKVKPVSWASIVEHFQTAIAGAKLSHDMAPFISTIEKLYMKEFGLGLGNRFEERFCLKFLPVFIAAGGAESDGLDHLVRTRLVRRLERMRDPTLRQPISRLRDLIATTWPVAKSKPRATLEALDRLTERLG